MHIKMRMGGAHLSPACASLPQKDCIDRTSALTGPQPRRNFSSAISHRESICGTCTACYFYGEFNGSRLGFTPSQNGH